MMIKYKEQKQKHKDLKIGLAVTGFIVFLITGSIFLVLSEDHSVLRLIVGIICIIISLVCWQIIGKEFD